MEAKFKVGDRVIVSDSSGLYSGIIIQKFDSAINSFHSYCVMLYNQPINEYDIDPGSRWYFENRVKFDQSYYRDLKLKDMLDDTRI